MVLSVNCSCYPKNYFLGFYLNFAVFIVQFSRYKEHKMYNILCSPNWTSFSLLFVRFLFFLLAESIKETFGQLALLVGSSGLEPPTLRLSGVRSNHLSYEPISLEWLSVLFPQPVVEMRRIELLTPCVQGRCSPSWATPPNLVGFRNAALPFSFWESF